MTDRATALRVLEALGRTPIGDHIGGAGPPRLLLSLVEELPPSRLVQGRYRVVDVDRLRRELIGAVGARADLFALLERAERKAAGAVEA